MPQLSSPRGGLPAAILCLGAMVFGGVSARADGLDRLLRDGPVTRVSFDSRGAFQSVTAIADVDAPAEILWRALIDFEHYRFFMPRVEQARIRRDGGRTFVDWEIATPLVTTTYTNEVQVDAATMTLKASTIAGDMAGSRYDWQVIPLSTTRSRLVHGAWPKNYAAIVHSLDDDQQTLTIGVAVGSVLSTTRAFQARAAQLARSITAPPSTTPSISAPSLSAPSMGAPSTPTSP